MTEYNKLVEALRRCQFGHGMCAECPYYGHKGRWNGEDLSDCDDKMHLDAADAIEALQEYLAASNDEVNHLAESNKELQAELNGYADGWDEARAKMEVQS